MGAVRTFSLRKKIRHRLGKAGVSLPWKGRKHGKASGKWFDS